MKHLSVKTILELTGGRLPQAALADASGVSFHTSRVKPGDAFFALSGAAMHGIKFANEALQRGAAFVVSDRPHPQGILVEDAAQSLLELGRWARRQYEGEIIGITGSAGKTSTKAFVAAALGAPSSPGNFNTPFALATTLVDSYLAQKKAEPLILELGIDHVGEMAQLTDLVAPSHGLITLIAESHLEGLGSLEQVASEKSQLLYSAEHKFASYQTLRFLDKALRPNVTSYGLNNDAANIVARVTEAEGLTQIIDFRDVRLRLGYPGRAMAYNAVAALVLAEVLGAPLKKAAERIEAAVLEPGRLQALNVGNALILDDSYNSNPASAKASLEVLRASPGPHTAVLGDMLELGQEAQTLHKELGEQTQGLDRVIAIGEHAEDLKEGNPDVETFASLGEALTTLSMLELKGTILVKGSRGMRLERVLEVLKQGVPA